MAHAKAPTRRRRWPLVLAVLAVLLAAAVWWLSRLLEPERLAALLLDAASDATGLQLHATGPAAVGLWPDLHVQVSGFEATAPGERAPLFTASRLDLVLPWSALVDRQPVLQRLRMSGPVLQRDALLRWLDSRPEPVGPAAPLRLPELTAGIELADASVTGDDPDAWALHGLDLSTSPLLPGHRFTATMHGVLHLEQRELAIGLSLDTTPRTDDATLLLEPLSLLLEAPMLAAPLQLDGSIALQPSVHLALRLGGRLEHWPTDWPAAPADVLPIDFSLAYQGATDLSAPLSLQARMADGELQSSAMPDEVLAWLQAPQASPLPPVEAQLELPRLVIGDAVLEGIEVRLAPAPDADEPQGAEAQ